MYFILFSIISKKNAAEKRKMNLIHFSRYIHSPHKCRCINRKSMLEYKSERNDFFAKKGRNTDENIQIFLFRYTLSLN